MMEQYRYPCGAFEECTAEELWKNEIACALTGYEACIRFNGTVYYVRNIPEEGLVVGKARGSRKARSK